MKNTFLIPTDKPSRLWVNNLYRRLELEEDVLIGSNTAQHIYIISDEEIKPNVYALINKVLCKTELLEGRIVSRQLVGGATMDICKSEYLEIILTTDQDLIQDGIQSIDDEFLEWFINNSSCEEVKTYIVKLCTNCGQQHCDNIDCRGYEDEPQYLISFPNNTTQRIITYCDGYEVNTEKIIIPKETSADNLELVAYQLIDNSNLAEVQKILTDYLIEYEIYDKDRDMTIEGHSFAKESAFYDVFVRNGRLDEFYKPVYHVSSNLSKDKFYMISKDFIDARIAMLNMKMGESSSDSVVGNYSTHIKYKATYDAYKEIVENSIIT